MLYPDKIAISCMQPWMNGTTVTIDHSQQITTMHINPSTPSGDFKTVNIYSLSLSSWDKVKERLERNISLGKVNEYYETIFAEMADDASLSFQAVFFDVGRWYEIDTLGDLREAERIFSESHRRNDMNNKNTPFMDGNEANISMIPGFVITS